MPMTNERWNFLLDYPKEIFGSVDPRLETLMDRAVEAGLPPISITHGSGQLLKLLASLTNGRIAIEVGTLGGFSGICIARGLAPDGRLITVEYSDLHADFAQGEFDAAGLGDRVEIVRGAALDVLPGLVEGLGPDSVDFLFIDAVKDEYISYFEVVKPALAPGALAVADNVYGIGKGWLDEGFGTDDFNKHVAADTDFDATTVHVGGGLLIARRSL
ncbi:MAG: O-methyltransferase [Actinomycetota bacterium]|nr:O-methyltransferase [Actinomycetota bacterium]